VHAVARAVNATPELIEDACQNAWTILLRRQPDRVSVFGWLYVVAIREAYRLSAIERRPAHLEDIAVTVGWEKLVGGAFSMDDALEARVALRLLADLPERQRDDLAFMVAGFSYQEIAAMTGGRTFTNVNKHLAKARARIRLERLRGTTPPREQDAPRTDR
jgi:DNA-directed RNA polymerase specialized sigma24 family protein